MLRKIFKQKLFANFSHRYFSESTEFTALDRLLRFKPAIVEEDDELDIDGVPEGEEHATEEEMRDPRYRLGRQLLKMGKVNYRHIEPLPLWLQEKQREVSSHRTTPQIRRCLDDWMIKTDRDMLDRFRLQSIGWKKSVKEGKEKAPIVYGPEEAVAYSHYFMPGRFAITRRVFRETKALLPNFRPRRVLDYGCGPATAGAAAVDVWGTEVAKYTGIDMSRAMLDAAKAVMENPDRSSSPAAKSAINVSSNRSSSSNDERGEGRVDSIFYDKIAEVVRRAEHKGDRFDLVIASYTLTELISDPARRAATQLLFELLDEGGVLVLIEVGNPLGSHAIRSARQLLLDSFNHQLAATDRGNQMEKRKSRQHDNKGAKGGSGKFDDQTVPSSDADVLEEKLIPVLPCPNGYTYDELGVFTIAPCTHDKPCPLARGVWCSFSQKVQGGVIRKASEEKFSYVVMQKRKLRPEELKKKHSQSMSAPVVVKNQKKKDSAFSQGNDSVDLWTLPHHLHNGIISNKGRENSPVVDLHTDSHKMSGGVEKTNNSGSEMKMLEKMRTGPRDGGNGRSISKLTNEDHVPTPLEVLDQLISADVDEVSDVVDQLVEEVDWEEYSPPLYRHEWGRVLRSPLKASRHVTLDLCMPSGEVARNTLSKSNVMNVPSLYTALRKVTWGGLFPVILEDQDRSPLAIEKKGVARNSYLHHAKSQTSGGHGKLTGKQLTSAMTKDDKRINDKKKYGKKDRANAMDSKGRHISSPPSFTDVRRGNRISGGGGGGVAHIPTSDKLKLMQTPLATDDSGGDAVSPQSSGRRIRSSAALTALAAKRRLAREKGQKQPTEDASDAHR